MAMLDSDHEEDLEFKAKVPKQLRKFFMTANTKFIGKEHTTETTTMESMLKLYLDRGCKQYAMQLESGKETGRLHFHLAGEFSTPRNFESVVEAIKAVTDVHPKVEVPKYYKKAMDYACKLDTRVAEPFLKGWTKPQVLINKWKTLVPFKWQLDVLEWLKTEPSDREILWLWSREGGAGKSTFARHLIIEHDCKVIGGAAKNIYFAVATLMEKYGYNIPTLIVNQTMSESGQLSYKALESLKDGFFFSEKYESGEAVFNTPHVIVFANSEPFYDMMTNHRFIVFNVDKPLPGAGP